jgi:hypothetical protein
MFKEMDFNSLWNSLFLHKVIRERMAIVSFVVIDSEKSNISSIRSGSSSNNTQLYK